MNHSRLTSPLAFAAYLALAAVMTWPLAASPGTLLGGGLDPLLQSWILAWDAHALRSNPAGIWQAPIFFPYPDTLAYTDHHLAQLPIAAPVIWLTGNPALAHNLLVLLSYALSGLAVFLLAGEILGENRGHGTTEPQNHGTTELQNRRTAEPQNKRTREQTTPDAQPSSEAPPATGHEPQATSHWLPATSDQPPATSHQPSSVVHRRSSTLAAFVAGAAFAFCTFRMAQFVHLQMLQTAWLPLALLYLRRVLLTGAARRRWRDALLLALFVAVQCAAALYYSYFVALALGLYTGLWAVRALWRRLRHGERLPWGRLVPLAAAGLLVAAIVIPLALPYLRVYQTLGIVRSARELENWSAPLQAYLAVDPGNRLYGRVGGPFEASGGEFALFPGALISLLALAGIWAGLRRTTEQGNKGTREQTTPDAQPSSEAPQATSHQPPATSHQPPAGKPSSIIHRPSSTGVARLDTIFLIGVVAIALVLSFGTALRLTRGGDVLPLPLPYELLYERLPGFGALRVPARWGMLVSLALCLLAGRGLHRLAQARWLTGARPPGAPASMRHAAVALAALLAVLGESATALPFAAAPDLALSAPVYRWLGEPAQADVRAVLELPAGRTQRGEELEQTMRRQYAGVLHWRPLVAGYSGLIPFGTTDLLGRAQGLPDEDALRFLQLAGVDTLVLHRSQYDPEALQKLVAGLEASPLARRRAEIGEALIYTLPQADGVDLPAGASVLLTADERAPGLPALGLARRWGAGGAQLYGTARVRYYGRLGALRAGQVPDFALLADAEDPRPHGFEPGGLRWRAAGLALYARDPALRANLALGAPPIGRFHPAFEPAAELLVNPGGARIAGHDLTWQAALAEPYLEADIASLAPQELAAGEVRIAVPAGASTITFPAQLGQRLTLAGRRGQTAILRIRVREGQGAPPSERGLAVAAESAFEGSRLSIAVQAGGGGTLLLEVVGAAAYDDRPIRLLEGRQPLPPDGFGAWSFSVDLLRPSEPWLQHAGEAQDGRYIVYLKDAGRPEAPGLPIAKFNVRGGRVADPEPVPLPLAELR